MILTLFTTIIGFSTIVTVSFYNFHFKYYKFRDKFLLYLCSKKYTEICKVSYMISLRALVKGCVPPTVRKSQHMRTRRTGLKKRNAHALHMRCVFTKGRWNAPKVVVDPKPRMRSKQHTDRRTLCWEYTLIHRYAVSSLAVRQRRIVSFDLVYQHIQIYCMCYGSSAVANFDQLLWRLTFHR